MLSRAALSSASLARSRAISTTPSPAYAARSPPIGAAVDVVRRRADAADSPERAFEKKLDGVPANVPVRRSGMLDELWADVEAEFGRRPPKERLADWPKEMKEPAERVTKSKAAIRRQAEGAVQAELRRKWPDTFDYTVYDPRLVLATTSTPIEEQLARMRGPFGFDLQLVHLAQMDYKLPEVLRRFIEGAKVLKLGVQISGDTSKLKRDFDVTARGCVEINDLHLLYGGEGTKGRLLSLQRLVGHYMERYLPKEDRVRLGRWSEELAEEQIHYAANDVYASLMVVERAARAVGRSAEELVEDLVSLAR